MKTIVGIITTLKNGKKTNTIHYVEEFDDFRKESDNYIIVGQRADSIYVGTYDVSTLAVGDNIEIYYGEYVHLSDEKGFAPIKKIEVV